MTNENQAPEVVEQAPEVKSVPSKAAPRHEGKLTVKKKKSFAEIEAAKQIESVKLWGKKVLEAQVASKNVSAEMKKACEAELKARAEKHAELSKKK